MKILTSIAIGIALNLYALPSLAGYQLLPGKTNSGGRLSIDPETIYYDRLSSTFVYMVRTKDGSRFVRQGWVSRCNSQPIWTAEGNPGRVTVSIDSPAANSLVDAVCGSRLNIERAQSILP